VRVVQLNGNLFREEIPILIVVPKAADKVRERTGNQEILLDEAQCLTGDCRIVGVQYARDGLSRHPIYHGTNEIAGTELAEVKEIRRSRRPKPERVDVSAAVANYRTIIGNA
jgi:hypothetical protein